MESFEICEIVVHSVERAKEWRDIEEENVVRAEIEVIIVANGTAAGKEAVNVIVCIAEKVAIN